MTPDEFYQALKDYGIILSDVQREQFSQYYELLVETNKHLNLTAITEKSEVYLKHFYDSLLPALNLSDVFNRELSLCDVGAGAGFPSIPLKIVFPKLQVTIIDSLNKRINFLKQLTEHLGITGVNLVHARAEEFGGKNSQYRESFDIVTARAVARMSILSEFCLPLTKVGGEFIALKAQKSSQELDDGLYAVNLLGGKIREDIATSLPNGDERHIVVVDKVMTTPVKYPRKSGTPVKKPLEE